MGILNEGSIGWHIPLLAEISRYAQTMRFLSPKSAALLGLATGQLHLPLVLVGRAQGEKEDGQWYMGAR